MPHNSSVRHPPHFLSGVYIVHGGQFGSPVTTGLAVHLDPSNVSTITGVTGVSNIADQAGSSDDFSQSEAAWQPAYVQSGGPGGNNYLEFAGDYLANTSYLPAAEKTVFAVVRVPSATANSNSFFYALAREGGPSQLRIRFDNPGPQLEFRRGGDDNLVPGSMGPLNEWYAQVAIDTAALRYIEGGVEQTLTGTSTQSPGTRAQNTLAVRGSGGATSLDCCDLTYDLAQFLVYDRVLSNAEIDQVGLSLKAEFGVAWTPIIPEPSAVVLLNIGLAGLAVLRRRRR